MPKKMSRHTETVAITCHDRQINASLIGASITDVRATVAKVMARSRQPFVIPSEFVAIVTTKTYDDPAFADLPGRTTPAEFLTPWDDGPAPVQSKRVPEDYVLRPGDVSVWFDDIANAPK